MPKHGEYQAGRGFYDASLRGWIRDAAKLTQVTPAQPIRQDQREQVASWGHRLTFKPVDQYERLLRMRDSDRQEERETYQKMVAGRMRLEIAEYETNRRAAIDAGDYTPDGA